MARILALGPLRLDADAGMLTFGERLLPLGGRGVALLHALAAAPGECVSKARLMEAAWPGLVVGDNNLTVQIAAIRRALAQVPGGTGWLETLARRGYRYTGPCVALRKDGAGEAHGPTSRDVPVLVGRHRELEAITQLLARHRLLTLTGPGGIGKTRLALALSDDPPGDCADGVFPVFLDSVTDAGLVPSALARALGVQEGAGPLIETLQRHLAQRRALIVLDNCEHLTGTVGPLAAALLAASPGLRILATSREELGIRGECGYAVPPMALPQAGADPDAVLAADAVRLFLVRARAQKPDLALSPERVATLAVLCAQLDGLPLAIELAAARVRSLSLEQIAARIDDRFRLLTAGADAGIARQQTLRATIDWSFDLLSGDERIVLRRLGVFAGGFDLEAVGRVAGDATLDPHATVDVIARLVQRSLVIGDGRMPARYRLLETTRAYALEKLAEADETGTMRTQHARHYLERFAPAFHDWLRMPESAWWARYLPELDNVRAAIAWSFAPGGDAATGVALTATSYQLWKSLALRGEGRQRLDAALSRLDADTPAAIAGLLWLRVAMAWDLFENAELFEAIGHATQRFGEAGDRIGLVAVRSWHAHLLTLLGEVEAAGAALPDLAGEDPTTLPPRLLANWFDAQSCLQLARGDAAGSRTSGERALALAKAMGADRFAISVISNLADLAWGAGELQRAESSLREGLALARQLPHTAEDAFSSCQHNLIGVLVERGETREALELARDTASFTIEHHTAWQVMDHLALRAALVGQHDAAARLIGFTDARHAAKGVPRQRNEQRARERAMREIEREIGSGPLASLLQAGAALADGEACRLALAG